MKLFITRLKVLIKRKENIFWVLLFPILLASAEYLAFGNMINSTPIDTIQIGVVEESSYELNEIYLNVFNEAKLDEDKKLFNVLTFESFDLASKALENDEFELLIYNNQETSNIEIIKKASSTSLTVAISVINQTTSIIDTINSYYENSSTTPNPLEIQTIISNLTKEVSYFNDTSNNKNATFYTVYFYSLIAMAAMFSCYFGAGIINDISANRSALGIRVSSSVVSKTKLIVVYYLAAVLLQFVSSLILYFYLQILNINLGDNLLLILVTLLLGGISGITFGMLVATFVNGTDQFRETILSVGSLVLSIFAGLMSVEIKHMIDTSVPFLNYINPSALITNSLYSLYYYDNYNSYILYSSLLLGFSVIGFLIIIIKMRGKKYASL